MAAMLAEQYRWELHESVLPFWERHSIDGEAGGYFTCLDRRGEVYDTDKFIWLQARQAWLFSMLSLEVEPRESWRRIAAHGIDFLKRHGRDDTGRWYFALARRGEPLIQPHSIFSDCFAAMAMSRWAELAGDAEAAVIARTTWEWILRRRESPQMEFSRGVPGARPLRMLALPMILANLAQEMRPIVPAAEIEALIDEALAEIRSLYPDRETGLIHEHAAPDGEHPDCFEGRLANPGHAIEMSWFLMEAGERRGDRELIEWAADRMLAMLELGWDPVHGGIFYFLDLKGRPPEQLEWDQKLWWVHLETLVALAMALRLTGRPACRQWFERVHDWAWTHFPDRQHGEWFGYLNRRGEILLDLKGGKWKGCFHVPRGLERTRRELEKLGL